MLNLKTLRKVLIKVQRSSARWSFPLSFCLIKLTPGSCTMKLWDQLLRTNFVCSISSLNYGSINFLREKVSVKFYSRALMWKSLLSLNSL